MEIQITSGIGEGVTETAAFDAALLNAGIGNYNLLYLSSIIPPKSKIVKRRIEAREGEYGNRLYVVIAKRLESEEGKCAWAGLGWTQEDLSGKGFFAEEVGGDRESVSRAVTDSLGGMTDNRCFLENSVGLEIIGLKCNGRPVCAIVAAIFCIEPWENI